MNIDQFKKFLQQEHTLTTDMWKGAVLFLVTSSHVIFIKRSNSMPTHPGQIAFIGGHRLKHESDPWITVLREYTEETNLDYSKLDFLGYLPAIMTARLQPIVPVMAKLNISLEEFFRDVKSNGEWDEILAYPWSELLIGENWNFAWRNGYSRGAIHFHTIKGPSCYESRPHSHLLWGATAGMVWDFLRLYFKHQPPAY
jgi:8-oxo-dGTP pyrophosphatase MutT (NUDIX family)